MLNSRNLTDYQNLIMILQAATDKAQFPVDGMATSADVNLSYIEGITDTLEWMAQDSNSLELSVALILKGLRYDAKVTT